jgi:hypothetical protein
VNDNDHSTRHLLTRLDDAVAALGRQSKNQFDTIMTTIASFTAVVQTAFAKVNSDLDAISTDIASLNAQITAFNNSPGTLSTADQNSLDAISTAAAALQAKADGIVPPTMPPTPTP